MVSSVLNLKNELVLVGAFHSLTFREHCGNAFLPLLVVYIIGKSLSIPAPNAISTPKSCHLRSI